MGIAVSFDFWNTLYANGDEAHRQVLRKKYFSEKIQNIIAVDPQQIDRVFDSSTRFFVQTWKNEQRTPGAAERVVHMTSLLGLDLDETEVYDIADYFGRLIIDVPPREIEFLKDLLPSISQKYPLGLISDTGYIAGKHIRRFLKQENLISCFRSFIFSDEHSHSKPHRTVFKKTADNLGIDLRGLIHIGDLERTDVAGARGAGCIAVKFTGADHAGNAESMAHIVIDSYEELPEILDRISADPGTRRAAGDMD